MLTSTTKNEVVLSISEGEYRVYDNYLSEYHSNNLFKSLTYIFTGIFCIPLIMIRVEDRVQRIHFKIFFWSTFLVSCLLSDLILSLIDWKEDLVVSFTVAQLLAEFHFEIV
eukprot:snap_masked-scaffold_45-processed-gene-0.44-mRNA-1 protein AED:1.00 eAED:1.00 QI:0/0/0/0/1/1/2/0/110